MSQTYAYTYDDNGNRASLTATGADEYVTSYAYDANNRLLMEIKTSAALVVTTNYGYDANGNQISKAIEGVVESETSRYNGFNQLVETNTGGVASSYTYAPLGLRAAKTVDGTRTDFILDGDNVVLELVGGAVTAKYIRGMNLVRSEIGSNTSYYLYNGHGDVVQLADAAGTVTKEYDYDAFGNEKNPAPSDTNPFRYCGEYFDISSGTYYLRARYYDPTIGRFLAEDTHWNPQNMIYGDYPVRISQYQDLLGLNVYTYAPDINAIRQSTNLYVYCGNNPVIYVDQDGHIFMLVTGAIGAVVGGVAGGIYSYAKYGEVRWQNVVGGVAIGGAIGLTGGAAAAVITTGSATASTTLVGIGAAKIVGGAATAGTAVATRVIGSYPEYIAKAKDVGARFFQVPTNIWNQMSSAEQWAANQTFLDRAINQGAHFVLESSKKVAEYGPYLQKEIKYLLEHGYKFVESGTKLIPK